MSKSFPAKRPDVNKLVEVFLSSKNQNTLDAYRRDLQDFRKYVNAKTNAEAISKLIANGAGNANLLVLEYQSHLRSKGLQAASINRKIAALRSVVRLARTLGLVTFTLEIPSLKVTLLKDTRGLGKQGVEEILHLIDQKDNDKAVRDRAIVHLLFSLALRVSEVVKLDLDDVDLTAKTLAVLGKGQHEKLKLDIPPKVIAALKAWVDVRGTEPGPLFFNLDRLEDRRKRITRFGVYYVVKYLGAKLGIKNSHPHAYRHSGISTALSESKRLDIRLDEYLQFSRHATLRALQVYLDRERNVQGKLAKIVSEAVKEHDDDEE